MSVTPIHQFRWDLTLPAVRAAWAAGQALIDDGKPVPRKAVPEYRESDTGWPLVVAQDDLLTPSSAPVDWLHMFTTNRSSLFTYVFVGDVPELSRALEAVREASRDDEDFGGGMNAFFDSGSESMRDRSLEYEFLKFVGAIIGRAVATNVDSDGGLLEIYLHLERARFAPELRGDLIVPLTLIDMGTVDPLALGAGVTIERLSEDLQRARALNSRTTEGISPCLVAAATHAVVLKDVAFANVPYAGRVHAASSAPLVSADEMDKVDQVIQCVHIVTANRTGYNQVLVRPDGWADEWTHDLPAVWKIEAVSNFPEFPFRAPWQGLREQIGSNDVQEIAAAHQALVAAPNDVKLAARRSVRAMMRTNEEDRTLDATIGVEALLLDSNAELKYRMALRAAAALFDEYQTEAIFELARKVYDHRSEIAHGSVKTRPTLTFDGNEWNSADIAPFLLRALLRSRLLSKHPWTKAVLETRILAALNHYRNPPEVENVREPGPPS